MKDTRYDYRTSGLLLAILLTATLLLGLVLSIGVASGPALAQADKTLSAAQPTPARTATPQAPYQQNFQPDQPTIINGVPVAEGSRGFAVALYVKKENEERLDFQCGGTLIASNVVITAKHCLQKNDSQWYEAEEIMIKAGSEQLTSTAIVDVAVREVAKRGPCFVNNETLDCKDDLALLQLSWSGSSDEREANVCLLGMTADQGQSPGSPMYSYVAGWGRTSPDGETVSHLREAVVQLQSPCPTPGFECTVDNLPQPTGILTGDSGGPFFRLHPKPILLGIAHGYIEEGHVSYFTSVATYWWWIHGKIDEWAEDAPSPMLLNLCSYAHAFLPAIRK